MGRARQVLLMYSLTLRRPLGCQVQTMLVSMMPVLHVSCTLGLSQTKTRLIRRHLVGLIANKNAREYDHIDGDLDWKRNPNGAATKPAHLDVEPSSGSMAFKHARDYTRLDGEDDWDGSSKAGPADVQLDTEASSGLSSANHAREYDAGAARFVHTGVVANKDALDTEASGGSIANKNAREYDHIDGDLDWKRNPNGAATKPAHLDVEPSSGSMAFKHARDYTRLDGEDDWDASNKADMRVRSLIRRCPLARQVQTMPVNTIRSIGSSTGSIPKTVMQQSHLALLWSLRLVPTR